MKKAAVMNKCTSIVGRFGGHTPVQCQAHRPMQHVQGYLRRHWTPLLGKYLPHIDRADAMVVNFGINKMSCGVVKLLSEASIKKANKQHHHHGCDAANSSSDVDSTNLHCPRGGRPCAYIAQGHCRRVFIGLLN